MRGFASAADEANAVAQTVAACRERHPGWRIAILVRARTHAREIAHALRARGMAFRAVDIEPLQDRAVVRDLVMLACALLHLGDRIAWLAVLRAPWCGLTLERSVGGRAARAAARLGCVCDDGVLEALSEDGRRRARLRGGCWMRRLSVADTHAHLPRWVERTWLALGRRSCAADARELDQVRAVFARLRELERQGLPDPADLVRRFADLYADEGAECAVEIMTIHKAKGLEFDWSCVPALNRHTGRAAASCSWPISSRARTGTAWSWRRGRPWGPSNRLFEFLRAQADGCGRARGPAALVRRLHAREIGAAFVSRGRIARGPRCQPPGEDGGRAHPARTRRIREVCGGACGRPSPMQFAIYIESPAAGTGRRRRLARRTAAPGARRWVPRRCRPRRRRVAPLPPIEDTREETPVFDWVGETARRVGILVHAELQATILRPRRRPPYARVRRISCAGWPCMACRRSAFGKRPNGSSAALPPCTAIRAGAGS